MGSLGTWETLRLHLDNRWRGGTAKPEGPWPQAGVGPARSEDRRTGWYGHPNHTEGRRDGPQGVGAPHSSVGGRGTCATGTLPSEGGAASRNCRWATGRGLRAPGAVHAKPAGSRAHVSPRRDEPDALVGHVRICGRDGGQPPSRPGPFSRRICKRPRRYWGEISGLQAVCTTHSSGWPEGQPGAFRALQAQTGPGGLGIT